MKTSYLTSAVKQFEYYKMLGEKAMAQLPDDALFWQYNGESNSIAVIVKHLAGNMLSRFTDFLTADGEKGWRNRDAEFVNNFTNREELLNYWNKGWECLFTTLANLQEEQLEDLVYIRNEGHTIVEALNRQLAHYPYHIGQIIYIAKMVRDDKWESLSIPRNKSNDYNNRKFAGEKTKRHFTDNV
ncbi:DUF1572 domain-containing protein [Zunongwangia sp. F363]|uniref:DUF1572 domain-containing protein n=1 Tax=Autumnicola tepida TaxID=3075595 RepID=A0ABU3CEN8_9FLAO|nr:DUF1572 domain-containing protein [Zunongwangia sp. F363]MDT0644814.1 DUF1572 domain-containing protein [Zunongwangia sp. F363]